MLPSVEGAAPGLLFARAWLQWVGGLGVLAVAVFATVLPARQSTAAILTVLSVGDVIACWHYRRDPDWSLIRRLLPAVHPGLVLGTLFLRDVSDDVH